MSHERPVIYEDLVSSEEMLDFARVLRSVLNGRSNVMETSDWTVQSYTHAYYAVDCVYHPGGDEQAVLSYTLGNRGAHIEMENTHRRAHSGSGVTVFSYVEHMAAALSRLAEKPIHTIYPLYGQLDTERFLRRRGYNAVVYFPMGSLIPTPALAWTYGK